MSKHNTPCKFAQENREKIQKHKDEVSKNDLAIERRLGEMMTMIKVMYVQTVPSKIRTEIKTHPNPGVDRFIRTKMVTEKKKQQVLNILTKILLIVLGIAAGIGSQMM